MTAFVQHTASIPIQAKQASKPCAPCDSKVSWGLRIPSTNALEVGAPIELSFCLAGRQIQASGHVDHCTCMGDRFEIFVRFSSLVDCHKARQGEQVCQMEQWLQTQTAQGRKLEREQAYAEWLSLFAASFPGIENLSAA